MSNYVKITDYASKDALTTGDPLKLIKGTEINAEFNAIQTAVATKADLASPAFTGNPTATTQATGNSTTRLATTAFVNNQIDADIVALGLGTLSTQNSNNVLITGGTISGVGLSSLSSLTIPSNATAVTPLVGDNSTKVATTEFVNSEIAADISNSFTSSNQSLTNPGYQKLPGGLIIQWGTCSSGSTTSFPIPFPVACLSITATISNANAEIWLSNLTRLSFKANTNQNAFSARYIAIGY